MDTLTKVAAWVALAAVLALGAMTLIPASSALFGVTKNTGHQEVIPWGFGTGIQVGSASVAPLVKKFIPGTCSLIASAFSVVASTTVSMDCAVPGAVSGDLVMGWFATTSQSVLGPGWEVIRASASSTAGYLTFNITNGTGGTATIPASIASSTQYIDIGL